MSLLLGPPAEEAESQPWEAGFQRVDSVAVAAAARCPLCIPDATDAQGWTTSAGLVILPAWPFAAFCSSDSLEASAWWCHWLIGTPLPQTLPYTQTSNLSPAEQLTREPGRVLCLAHIYILAYVLTK